MTPRPQPGNPRPRLFRLPQKRTRSSTASASTTSASTRSSRTSSAPAGAACSASTSARTPTRRPSAPPTTTSCACEQVYPRGILRDDQRLLAEHRGPARAAGEGVARRRCSARLTAARETLRDAARQARPAGAQDRAGPRARGARGDRRIRRAATGIDGVIATNTSVSRDGVEGSAARRGSRRPVGRGRFANRATTVLERC